MTTIRLLDARRGLNRKCEELFGNAKIAEAIYRYLCDGIEECEDAEPEWIPVTERLPKENGDYLVTGRQGAVNKRKYADGRWYGNWAVVAWMPLPEPWKGEDI